ncbi:MAG: hypothetical protein IPF58_09655 [Saprospirales bacterium]|nr:hypothetical protein [Saprospirales bacterium]
MGFPGYFLIVQDFINEGKIRCFYWTRSWFCCWFCSSYAIGITNVDPIKYNLLFERFLNPDRISMPDIDIDFDDEGRQKVIDYAIEKYGKIRWHKLLLMELWPPKVLLKMWVVLTKSALYLKPINVKVSFLINQNYLSRYV